jgi:hypothetical protein
MNTTQAKAEKFLLKIVADLEIRAAVATGAELSKLERAIETYRNSAPLLAKAKRERKARAA